MNIYFAGSIRGGRDDWAIYWEIVAALGEYGNVLTEHLGDPKLSGLGEDLDDREIYERDLAWLKDSNYLVAEVTTQVLAWDMKLARPRSGTNPYFVSSGHARIGRCPL